MLNQWMMGPESSDSALIMRTFPEFPMSLMFSVSRREGRCGKGKRRVWIEEDGWAERSGLRIGRFLGVTKMVMVRPWTAN